MQPAQDLDRYIRQVRYAPLGREGQERLAAGRALVCGCGALGSVLANTLVRAGVGNGEFEPVDGPVVALQSLLDEGEAVVSSGI
jgi:molybdopterin/thiamine biosynthesis adenylyltransferase